jgi:dihydroorotate dehydrogenase
MDTNLQVEVGGLVLKNPVIVGSTGYTDDSSGIRRFIERGYSAVVTKSTSKEPLVGSPPPRVFWYDPYKRTWLDGSEAHRNCGMFYF